MQIISLIKKIEAFKIRVATCKTKHVVWSKLTINTDSALWFFWRCDDFDQKGRLLTSALAKSHQLTLPSHLIKLPINELIEQRENLLWNLPKSYQLNQVKTTEKAKRELRICRESDVDRNFQVVIILSTNKNYRNCLPGLGFTPTDWGIFNCCLRSSCSSFSGWVFGIISLWYLFCLQATWSWAWICTAH